MMLRTAFTKLNSQGLMATRVASGVRFRPSFQLQYRSEQAPQEPEPEAAPVEDKDKVIEKLKADLEEARGKMLRSFADLENYRKIVEQQNQKARQFAIRSFAKDILDGMDNFQRARDFVPASLRTSAEPAFQSFLDGFDMTEKTFLKIFERNGVVRFDPTGAAFDPELHNAIAQVPSPDKESGTVLKTEQVGYTMHGQILRPARVIIVENGE